MQGKLGERNKIGTAFAVSGMKMDATLDKLIMESFRMSDVPEKDIEKHNLSVMDKKALDIMEKTTRKLPDSRWETGLLWKTDETFPSSTYDESYSRLIKTEKRMEKNPSFAEVYKKKIEEYLAKGYIRKIEESESAVTSGETFYIPHFGVINPNKPGKFRLVFDCAAQMEGKSLNDFLLTGPDLLRPLPVILWNFRVHNIVICGDIEDMFHRVFIREDDRRAQRFLWRDGDSSRLPDVYEMNVMIFGATCSPSCAIYVKDRNAGLFEETFPVATRAIKEDFYMDDGLCGDETVEKVIKLREDINMINYSGGFVIKKWMSNSKEVMESIPPDLRLGGTNAGEKGIGETERVLGLYWNPEKDKFTFRLNFNKVKPDVMRGRQPTKREMCSLIMSLYDPLGFVAHFKVKALMVFQKTWSSGIGWDDSIPNDIYDEWKIWLAQLSEITGLEISVSMDQLVETHVYNCIHSAMPVQKE